jgi:hypothetical protein
MVDQLFLLEETAEAVEEVLVLVQEMLLELQTQVAVQEAVLLQLQVVQAL